jgi:hypothetical protein
MIVRTSIVIYTHTRTKTYKSDRYAPHQLDDHSYNAVCEVDTFSLRKFFPAIYHVFFNVLGFNPSHD